MSRRKKAVLGGLIGAVVLAAIIAPFAMGPILLAWEKHKAHDALSKLTPDDIKNLNTRPKLITLPTPKPGAPALVLLETESFIFRVPAPLSREPVKSKDSLILEYPQFKVWFLSPFSAIPFDAEYQRLSHEDFFHHQVTVSNARPDDIDAQPDISSIRTLSSLLAEKVTSLPLSTFFAQYSQDNIRGFIRAVDPGMQKVHALMEFPALHLGCGAYFSNSKGIDPADVETLLAAVDIRPKPPSTASASPPATTSPTKTEPIAAP